MGDHGETGEQNSHCDNCQTELSRLNYSVECDRCGMAKFCKHCLRQDDPMFCDNCSDAMDDE